MTNDSSMTDWDQELRKLVAGETPDPGSVDGWLSGINVQLAELESGAGYLSLEFDPKTFQALRRALNPGGTGCGQRLVLILLVLSTKGLELKNCSCCQTEDNNV